MAIDTDKGPSPTNEQVQALVRHLREHPDALQRAPKELARAFKLDEAFVARMLQSLEASRTGPKEERPSFSMPFRAVLGAIQRFFLSVTENPILFVATTAAISIGLFTILDLTEPVSDTAGSTIFNLSRNQGRLFSFAAATILLHLACYFRHARLRFVLLGALACWLLSSSALMAVAWSRSQSVPDMDLVVFLLALAFGMLSLNAVYAGLGAIAAVLGGIYRMRRKDRQLDLMSRQELLQRLFELQDRLTRAKAPVEEARERAWRELSQRFRGHTWLYAIAIGIGMSLALMLVRAGMAGHITDDQLHRAPLVTLFIVTIQFGEILAMAVVAYFSRNVLWAMGNALLVELAGIPPFLLPVPHFGFGVVSSSLALNNVILMICLAAIVGAVAFAGSRVESRAARERSLHRDDPAALLAEVVRIQWKLQVQTAEVCVLVVDVSRSSEMKAGADPLKAEYSFREFQKFVEEACSASGGRIHSTAGDGAVVAFDCCAFALSAAKRLQSGLAKFNAERNRIDAPFRVRVGIHKGAVAGDLDKIMFTEVIDIAAHVQSRAPVGGIAISECVLDELPDEPVAPLKEPVDGFNVFFVLDPMGDA